MRAGPGTQYPVEWVYRRLGLPVEIVAEYRTWRQVRDVDGALGWIHRSMLAATRTIIVTGELQTLRRQPDPAAPAVAIAEAGVIGRLVECPAHLDWCQVEAGGVDGWLPHTALWGLLAGETVE